MYSAGSIQIKACIEIPNPQTAAQLFVVCTEWNKPYVVAPAGCPPAIVPTGAVYLVEIGNLHARRSVQVEFEATINGQLLSFDPPINWPWRVLVPRKSVSTPLRARFRLTCNGGKGSEMVLSNRLRYRELPNPTIGRWYALPPLTVELNVG
jgi:hypothetical protein